jgi:hypothetical protein
MSEQKSPGSWAARSGENGANCHEQPGHSRSSSRANSRNDVGRSQPTLKISPTAAGHAAADRIASTQSSTYTKSRRMRPVPNTRIGSPSRAWRTNQLTTPYCECFICPRGP